MAIFRPISGEGQPFPDLGQGEFPPLFQVVHPFDHRLPEGLSLDSGFIVLQGLDHGAPLPRLVSTTGRWTS